jgi:hypothetical protein
MYTEFFGKKSLNTLDLKTPSERRITAMKSLQQIWIKVAQDRVQMRSEVLAVLSCRLLFAQC